MCCEVVRVRARMYGELVATYDHKQIQQRINSERERERAL